MGLKINYHFDVEMATRHGVGEAIMLSNFEYWLAKNKADNRHYHDDRTWTYNSVNSLTKLFPFWSIRQVRRILKSLLDQEVLIKSTHNKHAYDKTNWYALTDESKLLLIGQKGQMDLSKLTNGLVKTDKPIPDSKHLKTTDIKDYPNINLESWLEFETHRNGMKPKMTELARKKLLKKLSQLSLGDQAACIDESIENGWKGLFPKKGNQNARSNESTLGGLTGAARQNVELFERIKRRGSR